MKRRQSGAVWLCSAVTLVLVSTPVAARTGALPGPDCGCPSPTRRTSLRCPGATVTITRARPTRRARRRETTRPATTTFQNVAVAAPTWFK